MKIPRLHPDTIEEIKQKVDIIDLISDYVALSKRGRDYLGLCPFHEEKTPSFTVSQTKQLYYCFGCGAGGNVFKFLMELRKQSFNDVVLELARRYQISIKTLEPEQRQELQRQLSLQESLYEILAVAASFYEHALRQPQGEIALSYLKNKRLLREETIVRFQLGYAPAGWETMFRYLVEVKRYPVDLVEMAGLILKRKSGEGYCDRFRDRVIIPIHDVRGRIIGFGSRSLGSEQPKYLNSPATPLFDKSKTLYALWHAKSSIAECDEAIIVEGYFDAISLHERGITNAVASLGTAFSGDQLLLILRYSESKRVVLNFDADSAGTSATQRAIEEIEALIYSGQLQLRVLHLAGGKDADEFLHSVADAGQIYRESVKNAPFWLDWQIKQLLVGQDLKSPDRFQQVAQSMIKLLARLQNPNQRSHYITRCAELLSQGDSKLIPSYAQNLIAQLKKIYFSPKGRSKATADIDIPIASEDITLAEAEADLLRIYLHYWEYRQEIFTAIEDKDLCFSRSHHRFLWRQILELQGLYIKQQEDRENRLLSLLQEFSIDFPKEMTEVSHLIYPHQKIEKHEKIEWEDPGRIPLLIEIATVTIEYVACKKYQQYCIEQLQKHGALVEMDIIHYYYQEILKIKQKIQELEQKRCTQIKQL